MSALIGKSQGKSFHETIALAPQAENSPELHDAAFIPHTILLTANPIDYGDAPGVSLPDGRAPAPQDLSDCPRGYIRIIYRHYRMHTENFVV